VGARWAVRSSLLLAAVIVAGPQGDAATTWTLVGANNLGMHCMDADFGVLSILPPYNTIQAQLVNSSGHLVTSGTGITMTYQAVADPAGSINTSSQGKTNFWQFAQSLFSLPEPLAADVGLTGLAMPGIGNQPQPMTFSASCNCWTAEGIPITPRDDAGAKNAYPMMRLVARDAGGSVLATTDIVLPVSDEMDCTACHASGSGPAAQPAAGWVHDADPQRDYRLNILRLHDQHRVGSPTFTSALAAAGYNAAGLYATVTTDGKPILCAKCHASNALGTTGQPGVPALTSSVHTYHAGVTDPTSGLSLESSANRSACYRCHPGATTRCLRGAMGNAVAADGTMAMQCQSCHGTMSAVGLSTRQGWLDEPTCQNCHTGTATHNNGQIQYTSALEANGARRVAVDQTYATSANTPAAGLSLFRFSRGHGGLLCEACHGSTHAEYPSSHTNDNVASMQEQGHAGPLVECASCHGTQPSTVTGGPHGMHPVGQSWVSAHPNAASSACQKCHGADYRGTVLSRMQADRTLSAFGTKSFWRGFQIGCYTCHNGPSSENATSNRPPVVTGGSATTQAGTPVTIPIAASDPDRNTLTLRVVTQPRNGTAALTGSQTTYTPFAGFAGTDSFTVAAWDGSTQSNLATVSVTVVPPPCSMSLEITAPLPPAVAGEPVTLSISVTQAGCTGPVTYDWNFGDGSGHGTTATVTHTYAAAGTYHLVVTVTADGTTATAQGDITVTAPPPVYTYLLFVAHNPGKGGTRWRSDLAVTNVGSGDAAIDLTFTSSAGTFTRHETVAAQHAVEWQDAVASLFGVAVDAQGPVVAVSGAPVTIQVHSYTPFATGTMGQSYPAASPADAIGVGQTGLLTQLAGTPAFRTNIGFLSLADVDASVSVQLFADNGSALGSALTASVPRWGWVQLNDVFTMAQAGEVPLGHAVVTVAAPGAKIWSYASVVDNRTGDPLTVLMTRNSAP
jgi:PKD repeat protein